MNNINYLTTIFDFIYFLENIAIVSYIMNLNKNK